MQTFSEIAEIQPLASRIITNSIQKSRVSHAYLLQGERGTGKEAIALLIAKRVFCEQPDGVEPCNHCTNCKRILSGNHPDVHIIEPDGQSIKKEQIEYLQKEFTYSGVESSQKVYIVKNADTLTVNAANRILKFLEEPSKQTTAIMLTDNSQSIIPTVRSRCQVIDLQPLSSDRFQEQLLHAGMSQAHARLMSALTNNVEEALHWNEGEWFAEARKVMIQLIEIVTSKPNDVFLFIHHNWLTHFSERNQQEQGLDLLLLAFKDILYYHLDYKDAMVVFEEQDEKLKQAALTFSPEKLLSILQAILEAKQKLKQNIHPTLVMEQLTLHIQR
ncbi:DNA polymerase III subunit delta' [Oceanobacillus halotolerans]|uniref:DNA polymerase III subunit delta' n=1 Tax=Oceanobacillus halotolerans TaxID=2663380 RepID=UPI0013D816E6|nr:DNA polymerase III subunit delta' [Oceanobacillus halotolerans]